MRSLNNEKNSYYRYNYLKSKDNINEYNFVYENLSPKRKNKINIFNIYEFLINNNYNIKKFNFSIDNQELYFINIDDNTSVIKIKINTKYYITIPLRDCNYEYSTSFNNINLLFNYLKFHVNYLKK